MIVNRELKQQIEQTKSLEEAVKSVFRIEIDGRTFVLAQESMDNGLAEDFDSLGRLCRADTYKQIAYDFISKINPARDIPHTEPHIVDIGCGSGILAQEISSLLARPEIRILGVDISQDMISLAQKNNLSPCVTFKEESVYNLHGYVSEVPYIVCRNSLHRFRDTGRALREMYSVLKKNGVIYIRDLRRDADWNTVIQRIGEHRWKSERLVRDYIGAMAQMLTTEELKTALASLRIDNFNFYNAGYTGNQEFFEHGREVEYVCVIKKD